MTTVQCFVVLSTLLHPLQLGGAPGPVASTTVVPLGYAALHVVAKQDAIRPWLSDTPPRASGFVLTTVRINDAGAETVRVVVAEEVCPLGNVLSVTVTV